MSIQSKGRAFVQFGADLWQAIAIVCNPSEASEILTEANRAERYTWPSLRRLGIRPKQ